MLFKRIRFPNLERLTAGWHQRRLTARQLILWGLPLAVAIGLFFAVRGLTDMLAADATARDRPRKLPRRRREHA